MSGSDVDRDRRAAIVALRLSEGGVPQFKWLYRQLEQRGASEAARILTPAYRDVVVMNDDRLTSATLVARLAGLAADAEVDAVDLVLVVHGLRGRLQFSADDVRPAPELAARLAESGAGPKLRLLYSSACFGATHADALLGAGFSAVIGAEQKNTTGYSEFRRLLAEWTGGATAADAVARSDRPVPRLFWDVVARVLGRMRHVNSRKRLAGDPTVTIATAP